MTQLTITDKLRNLNHGNGDLQLDSDLDGIHNSRDVFKLTFLDRGEETGGGGGGGELFIVKGPAMLGGWESGRCPFGSCCSVSNTLFQCLYKEQVRKHTWIK